MRKVMFERGQRMQMRRRKVVSLIMFSKNDSRWIYWDSKNWRCEQTNHYHNHHCHMFSFIIIIIIATCSQYHYNHYHHHHMFSTSWFSIHCRAHGSRFSIVGTKIDLIDEKERKGEESSTWEMFKGYQIFLWWTVETLQDFSRQQHWEGRERKKGMKWDWWWNLFKVKKFQIYSIQIHCAQFHSSIFFSLNWFFIWKG